MAWENVLAGLGADIYPDLRLEWAPTSSPKDEDQRWVDISNRLRGWEWQSGRNDELAKFEPGNGKVILDNRDRYLDPSFGAVQALTVSGNEITDDTRNTATEGDGRDVEGSFGIWEATTDGISNGGLETNATGYTAVGSTVSRITTDFKFGAACGQCVTDNAAAAEGTYHEFTATAVVWTISAWVNAASGTVRLAIRDNAGADNTVGSAVTMDGTWQRITLSSSAALSAATFRLYIETDVQQALTFKFDGVQAEAQPLATPFVETDGATASRSAARVQAPSSLIDETQGWVAMRVRMGHANGTALGHVPYVSEWQDDGSNRITCYLDVPNGALRLDRGTGGTFTTLTVFGQTWARDDVVTLIYAWTATTLEASKDGAAFSSTADTNIPTLAAANFGVGNNGASAANHIDGDVLWFACGTGTLSDADAVTLNDKGEYDPTAITLGSAAATTFVWAASDANGSTGAPHVDGIKPRRMFRLRGRWSGTEYGVFVAHARGYPQTYRSAGTDGLVQVDLADDLAILQRVDLDALGFNRVEERSDERVAAILDEADIPAARRDVQTGTVTVAATAGASADLEGALKQIGQVVEFSERLPVFVTRDGKFAFF